MKNESDGVNLYFKFDSLDDFYTECGIIDHEAGGCEERIKDEIFNDNPGFRGLTNIDIEKYKYGYTPGIEKLQEIEDMFPELGSSKFKYKWNDIDGDTMDIERLYEGKQFLKERVRDKGNQNGKFVDMYVMVGENAFVSPEEMLYKAFAAVTIADYLENLSYKVRIYAVESGKNTGYYHDKPIDYLSIEILVKDYTEPINKSLLLNIFSPWFLRYWLFQIMIGKIAGNYGLGQAVSILSNTVDEWSWDNSEPEPGIEIDVSESREFVVIDKGDCLSEEKVAEKLEEIQKLFGEE